MSFRFGHAIYVRGTLERQRVGNKRIWVNTPLEKPEIGLFLKKINLYNGEAEIEYNGFEEGSITSFCHSQLIPGAWVCRKGRKPEKVFLDDITLMIPDKGVK